MTQNHEEWLSKRQEEIIDPELPICDPHHHLWIRPGSTYLLDEVLKDTGSGHNVVSTVFVECHHGYKEEGPEALRPVGETEFVQSVADQAQGGRTTIAQGIVSHADLLLGAPVAEVLEAHLAASPNRFRGIRDSAAWDPSPEIMGYRRPSPGKLLNKTFREGFACLARHGLSFDTWLYQPQIPELIDLARAFPETTIIMDHIGGPLGVAHYAGQRATTFQMWKLAIAEAATCPNMVVKVGGLAMASSGLGWHLQSEPPSSAQMAADMAPYYLWVIEHFGVERCMFESNFPVDGIGSSYATLWNAFKRLAADFSGDEKAALFHDTAARVYRL